MNDILMIKSRIVVDAIKPLFVSVQEVLRLYEGHMAQEHRTQHGNLIELLKTEFISVIYELSSSSTAMIAAPIFINCLMDSNYDYNELKAIHDMRDKAILDDVPITIQTVAFIDAALKNHVKMQQPLSQVILTLFEKIGKGYLRILNEGPNELFNAWINAHQQFVAAVKSAPSSCVSVVMADMK